MFKRYRETLTVHRNRESVRTKLHRVATRAQRQPKSKFSSLYHLIDKELLRDCFGQLRSDAAAGIDQITKEQYSQELEQKLPALKEQLQRMAYVPQPVKRKYIPKPGSTKHRPLGIPTLEDKLVQSCVVRILEPIYEQDFIEDSYGFRPGHGCHSALRSLSQTVESRQVNWIVEADIKGFFDHVSHDWMIKFLEHRLEDKRIIRLIKRFLKAGVVEDKNWYESKRGTPQGGVLSPLLANIYLHYVLDLWFMKKFRRKCRGIARLIRYADDFVVCFSFQAEATQFLQELKQRLVKFGLEVEPSKTKVIAFGPHAANYAKQVGRRKPETFDFLGLTHYCSRSFKGTRFRMKRKTSRQRFRAKLAAFSQWLKNIRMKLKTREIWEQVQVKLRGHFAYYGVTDNWEGIVRFAYQVRRLLFKWLNRRGGKRHLSWEKFQLMEKRMPLPKPRIYVKFF